MCQALFKVLHSFNLHNNPKRSFIIKPILQVKEPSPRGLVIQGLTESNLWYQDKCQTQEPMLRTGQYLEGHLSYS